MWMRRSPRSALISHLYLLSNPLWQPSIARDLVWEAMLLTQGYISITEGSESDAQLICLINPSFSKKNIWSWGADLLPCSYWQIKMGSLCMLHGYASRLHSIKRNLDSYLYGAQPKAPPPTHTHTYCGICCQKLELENGKVFFFQCWGETKGEPVKKSRHWLIFIYF